MFAFVKKLVKRFIYFYKWNSHQRIFYSQEGEDFVLERIFNRNINGFYIDVGAHHPIRFSNTYHLYNKGWSGINIDPLPNSMKIFNLYRPRDINLEIAISSEHGESIYYQFNEPALNGFSTKIAKSRSGKNNFKIEKLSKIETFPLSTVLDKNLQINKNIDLLLIDVEGLEFSVLKSNDWDKYKPSVIVLEILNSSVESILISDIYLFLSDKNYILFSKLIHSVFFVQKDFLNKSI